MFKGLEIRVYIVIDRRTLQSIKIDKSGIIFYTGNTVNCCRNQQIDFHKQVF